MVVQHNLQAMNANRMLGITSKGASSSTEKLSSGYRINRAADDAAGLAISEKMRKQMRGLTQASTNAEDGISCVQTAEGALAEVQDMLQRMNELCVQAANGTNSVTDRQYIQDEIDQMVTEIDRVSETTKFNELYLLKGDKEAGTTNKYVADYRVLPTENDNADIQGTPSYKYNYVGASNLYFVSTSITSSSVNAPITASVVKENDDITPYLNADADDKNDKYNVYANATLDSQVGGAHLQINTSTSVIEAATDLYVYDTDTKVMIHLQQGDDMSEYIDDDRMMKSRYRYAEAYTITPDTDLKLDESKYTLYDADGEAVSGIALNQYFDSNGNYTGGLFKTAQARVDDIITTTSIPEDHYINSFVKTVSTEVPNSLEFDLHVGSDSDKENKITTSIMSISAAGIGIDMLHSNKIGIVDKSGANATSAIDVVGDALQEVSRQRSALGAVQNRLEHTVKNLDNVVENTTAAESQIRDTDMAEEMVSYSNTNILLQAGQSMLAQANQSNQGVLTLLQG